MMTLDEWLKSTHFSPYDTDIKDATIDYLLYCVDYLRKKLN